MDSFCTRCGAELDADDRFCGTCGAARESADAPPAAAPSAPAQPVQHKGRGRIIAFAVLVAIVPAVAMFALDGCESIEGDVAVRGGPHGDFTFTPVHCRSMQPFGRFGAGLIGEHNNAGAVYLTIDPTRGSSVEIEVPGSCQNSDGSNCTVFTVPRDRCTTYDANVDFSGVTVNDVRLVEGHLRLECTLEDGTSVRGNVTFEGC